VAAAFDVDAVFHGVPVPLEEEHMKRHHTVLLATALLAPAWCAVPTAFALDEHPGRFLAANCTGCHGTQGRSIGGLPSLAGLDRSYILNAMEEFKSGTRAATIMHQHSKGYSEAQFELIADYFASQKAR
jgi:cytochrome subunit of sulfide dehydrogenase